ncbi:MAG TPA: type II secretion system F family protein [Aliidongia sp.]|uniref:type II secretion system F family protein n=1 Tax=Aliidongia sp. TaxID=1914230 RepID=UPI002DDD49B7|nr:type II secretion system F family protein [Aliidongia sp.]HEV2676363.1 type II secretion system F family protein [Aliidongia sp.]
MSPFLTLLLSPVTLVAILLALTATLGILLITRSSSRRIADRLTELSPNVAGVSALSVGRRRFGALGQKLAATPLIGSNELVKVVAALADAGIRGQDKLGLFIATKTTLALGASVGCWLALQQLGMMPDGFGMQAVVEIGSALLGWRLPDVVVSRLAVRRRDMLRSGIADVLDLLVICVETGLGLEQALDRVSRDIAVANPVIAEELAKTVAEIRVLPQMRDAFDNFAKRSRLPAIKSVMTTLIQTIQYGTPLAQSLRVLSGDMRAHRMLEIEERAARLPVLLTIPLIMFILPCLFIVLGGPAVLQVMTSFKG